VVELETFLAGFWLKIGSHGKNVPKRGYDTKIFDLMEENCILSMPSDRINLEYDFRKPFRVEVLKKENKNWNRMASRLT
jgi:hypothetical protein